MTRMTQDPKAIVLVNNSRRNQSNLNETNIATYSGRMDIDAKSVDSQRAIVLLSIFSLMQQCLSSAGT